MTPMYTVHQVPNVLPSLPSTVLILTLSLVTLNTEVYLCYQKFTRVSVVLD